MDSEENNSEVTIRSSAKVEGGTTCAPCVDRRYAECNVTYCLFCTPLFMSWCKHMKSLHQ